MDDRPPEDQRPPILREIAVVVACLLIVLYLTACAAATAPKPAFPPDMRLVCHGGAYYLGSVSADQVVRLPLSCT